MNCNDAMAALVASLENATTVDEETREHLRTCEQCGAMLRSAKEVLRVIPGEAEGSPAIDDAVAAAEREVARKRFWRGVRILLGVTALLAGCLMIFFVRVGKVPATDALFFAAAGFGIAVLMATPVLLVFWLVHGATKRLYKRLGRGRMLSGVCLGLAEATKIDVRVLRIIFVALFVFAHGAGLWLYLLLDLAMPVHPDDRQHLLRFKMRRWWNRMRNAEQHAG